MLYISSIGNNKTNTKDFFDSTYFSHYHLMSFLLLIVKIITRVFIFISLVLLLPFSLITMLVGLSWYHSSETSLAKITKDLHFAKGNGPF